MSRLLNSTTEVDSDSINTSYITTPDPVLEDESLGDIFNNTSPSGGVSSSDGYEEPPVTDNTELPVPIINAVLLSTITETTIVPPDIDIFTYYNDEDSLNLIAIFIGDEAITYKGVAYEEGDLVAEYVDSLLDINLDSDGNLIIDSNDANQYSLNAETGELIYTHA